MDDVTVKIESDDILPRIKMHLEVIGKRAVNVHGEKFYAKLTTSSSEDVVLLDFVDSAIECLVSELSEVVLSYSDNDKVYYFLFNKRWIYEGGDSLVGDITEALRHSIQRFLVMYTVGDFLSSVFPSGDVSEIPQYGSTYKSDSAVILNNIKSLSYLKRPAFSTATYNEMLGAGEGVGAGAVLSMLTLTRNGREIGTFNGVASKKVDIKVPERLSELDNDVEYLSEIDGRSVESALGYSPLDSSRFTKGGITAELGLSDWALGYSKPSYTAKEVEGLDELLDRKYDTVSFADDFRRYISGYQLGHVIKSSGKGNYIMSYSVSDDGKELTFHYGDMEKLVRGIVSGMIKGVQV